MAAKNMRVCWTPANRLSTSPDTRASKAGPKLAFAKGLDLALSCLGSVRMGEALLVLLIVGAIVAVVWARGSSQPRSGRTGVSTPKRPSTAPPASSQPSLAELERQMMREVDGRAQRMMPQVDAEARRLMSQVEAKARADAARPLPDSAALAHEHEPETAQAPQATGPHGGPSWMDEDDWTKRLATYERQGRTASEIAATASYLEQRGPKVKRTRAEAVARAEETGVVTRDVYVAKEDEARYLTRDGTGLPTVRLVDSGDRLSIWSPVEGGALINPKGPGLRKLGLYTSYARGSLYYASAFAAADLRKGRWVDLVREPDNPHDKNAIAMCALGSKVGFAHVQKGRAPAIAKRMDAGEDMAAVSLRGPGRGKSDDTAFVIIGTRTDLEAMLNV